MRYLFVLLFFFLHSTVSLDSSTSCSSLGFVWICTQRPRTIWLCFFFLFFFFCFLFVFVRTVTVWCKSKQKKRNQLNLWKTVHTLSLYVSSSIFPLHCRFCIMTNDIFLFLGFLFIFIFCSYSCLLGFYTIMSDIHTYCSLSFSLGSLFLVYLVTKIWRKKKSGG